MGTIALTYNGGLTSLNLHDFIILTTLPIGTLRYNEIQYIKYTTEYIPKLQIHQHCLGGFETLVWIIIAKILFLGKLESFFLLGQ